MVATDMSDASQFTAVVLDNVVVEPSHTFREPVIAVGSAFTTNGTVVRQPVGSVYDIVVAPAVPPLTIPALFTGAVTAEPVLHTPPGVDEFSALVWPTHALAVPVIASGVLFTVILRVL
jgi:hypothetical protein